MRAAPGVVFTVCFWNGIYVGLVFRPQAFIVSWADRRGIFDGNFLLGDINMSVARPCFI